MGSFRYVKNSNNQLWKFGKVKTPLDQKLEKVKWGEFKIGDLFEVNSYKKRFDANKVEVFKVGQYPYVVRMGSNNGQKGFINEDVEFLNDGNTISFGQDTATMYYQEKPYFTGDKIKILKPKEKRFNKNNAQFFISTMMKAFSTFSWGSSSFNVNIIKNQKVSLPVTKDKKIDFDFIESFLAELEYSQINKIDSYLSDNGLNDFKLTTKEEQAILNYKELKWQTFNLENLFGKSTRGKRLKSADRISGELPFVTAGEAAEGVSDFIGNNVTVFSANTTTIDMFGSAKYRNYQYGGDDHVAVVHTDKLPRYASIFVTSAIHKSSYNGQFNYGRNFYAKDADVLDISLPVKDDKPDYETMETIISAIHKLVIKDVVLYVQQKKKEEKI